MVSKINKEIKIILLSLTIFAISVIILFLLKLFTFFESYNLFVTSGAEVTTLNFLYNLLNGNNLLEFQGDNILCEFYGLNFHLIYFPFVKLFEIFNINYLFSSRIITTLLVLILPLILIKICEKINYENLDLNNNKKIFYFIILIFLINHQTSSWWIITYRPDIIAIVFAFLGVLSFLNFIEKNNIFYFISSIFLCVISWTLKQNFLFLFCSIFLFLVIKRKYNFLVLFLFIIPIFLIIVNYITGYNNLDLLNRSPGTIASYFEIRNYFNILLKYFIKNPILILLIFFLYINFLKKNGEKRIFLIFVIFFLFFQSSIISVLHGAGFNHLMAFMFFLLISVGLVNIQMIKKFYILISILLIISSFLNYYQLINYNLLGRQGLHFNNYEKNEIINFKKFIRNDIQSPIVIVGASNRTEMLLLEEQLGKDTFQITSYLDSSWRQFLFRSKNEVESYEKIFDKKFENINSVLLLNNSKNQKFLREFLKKKNFKFKKMYNVYVYEDNNFEFSKVLKLFKYKNSKDLLIEKQFLVFEKVIF